MTGNEAVEAVIAALEQLEISYMITGSFASNVYGLPRSTKDADFIIEAPPDQIDRLLNGLKPPLRSDPQMLFETVTSSRRWIVRVDRSPFIVELFLLNSHPYDRCRFDRRCRLEIIPGIKASLATAEDVVVQKIRWASRGKRPQDLVDASNVIQVSGGSLDWSYIEKWCAELDATAALAEARAMAEG
jgi:hypothetical protein